VMTSRWVWAFIGALAITAVGAPLAMSMGSLAPAWFLTPALAFAIGQLSATSRPGLLIGFAVNVLIWWSVLVVAFRLLFGRRKPVG